MEPHGTPIADRVEGRAESTGASRALVDDDMSAVLTATRRRCRPAAASGSACSRRERGGSARPPRPPRGPPRPIAGRRCPCARGCRRGGRRGGHEGDGGAPLHAHAPGPVRIALVGLDRREQGGEIGLLGRRLGACRRGRPRAWRGLAQTRRHACVRPGCPGWVRPRAGLAKDGPDRAAFAVEDLPGEPAGEGVHGGGRDGGCGPGAGAAKVRYDAAREAPAGRCRGRFARVARLARRCPSGRDARPA